MTETTTETNPQSLTNVKVGDKLLVTEVYYHDVRKIKCMYVTAVKNVYKRHVKTEDLQDWLFSGKRKEYSSSRQTAIPYVGDAVALYETFMAKYCEEVPTG